MNECTCTLGGELCEECLKFGQALAEELFEREEC